MRRRVEKLIINNNHTQNNLLLLLFSALLHHHSSHSSVARHRNHHIVQFVLITQFAHAGTYCDYTRRIVSRIRAVLHSATSRDDILPIFLFRFCSYVARRTHNRISTAQYGTPLSFYSSFSLSDHNVVRLVDV